MNERQRVAISKERCVWSVCVVKIYDSLNLGSYLLKYLFRLCFVCFLFLVCRSGHVYKLNSIPLLYFLNGKYGVFVVCYIDAVK